NLLAESQTCLSAATNNNRPPSFSFRPRHEAPTEEQDQVPGRQRSTLVSFRLRIVVPDRKLLRQFCSRCARYISLPPRSSLPDKLRSIRSISLAIPGVANLYRLIFYDTHSRRNCIPPSKRRRRSSPN